MEISMKKGNRVDGEDWIAEILSNKERFIADIKNSPAILRKNREATEQLLNLKPRLPHKKTVCQTTNKT